VRVELTVHLCGKSALQKVGGDQKREVERVVGLVDGNQLAERLEQMLATSEKLAALRGARRKGQQASGGIDKRAAVRFVA